jgi:hypothetical protein
MTALALGHFLHVAQWAINFAIKPKTRYLRRFSTISVRACSRFDGMAKAHPDVGMLLGGRLSRLIGPDPLAMMKSIAPIKATFFMKLII